MGRGGDSLYFQISGATTPLPPGYSPQTGDPSPPGFRYDLPSDNAVALPLVAKPPAPAVSYSGWIAVLSFFRICGSRCTPFPEIVVLSLRVGCGLSGPLPLTSSRCKWYKRAFNPLEQDCTWVHCPDKSQYTAAPTHDQTEKDAYDIWVQHGRPPGEAQANWLEAEAEEKLKIRQSVVGIPGSGTAQFGACCDSSTLPRK